MAVFPWGWGRYAVVVMLIEFDHKNGQMVMGGQSDDYNDGEDVRELWGN